MDRFDPFQWGQWRTSIGDSLYCGKEAMKMLQENIPMAPSADPYIHGINIVVSDMLDDHQIIGIGKEGSAFVKALKKVIEGKDI
jgi:hypothetical protein